MTKLPDLFVFDFDETLSIRASYDCIAELAPDPNKLDLAAIDERYTTVHRCWNRRMTELHRKLAEQGVRTAQLIEAFRTIDLSPGTRELFQAVRANNGQIIVVSNACDLLVEECLRAQNLLQYVAKIESNPVEQTQPVVIIGEYAKPLQRSCAICDPNLCKGAVIDEYRETNTYDKVIFAGDGDNDVCAALRLREQDYLFAKLADDAANKRYQLYPLLRNQYSAQLRAKLFVWKTLKDVHDILTHAGIL